MKVSVIASRITVVLGAWLFSSISMAYAACTVPNTLANGTPADASQVMADINAVKDCVNNAPAGATNSIQVNAGSGAFGGIAPLTNGQIVIGSTGAAPQAAILTAGANVTITNGPGSITIAASGGGTPWDFSPPTASSFAQMSGDGSTLTLTDDSNAGLLVDGGAITTTGWTRIAYRTLATRTSDWDMKVKIECLLQDTGTNNGYGLTARDGTGGKLLDLYVQGGQVGVSKNPSIGGWDADIMQVTGGFYRDHPKWLRIAQISGTLHFYSSASGKQWVEWASIGSAAYTANAPNQVGFWVYTNRTTGIKNDCVVPYFSLTGPGV